jgi:hypothetical protein
MVTLLSKYTEHYFERFNLQFHNGITTVTDVRLEQMRKSDPEIWDRLIDAKHIIVVPKDMKIETPKSSKEVKMRRFDTEEKPPKTTAAPAAPETVSEAAPGVASEVAPETVSEAPASTETKKTKPPK